MSSSLQPATNMSTTKPPNFSLKTSLNPLSNSDMTQNQLINSLTSHISLYHSYSLLSNPKPNPNPRSSILKWFSSLTVHQRQAHLTTVDLKFVRILMQMLRKVRMHGHGFFIVLPDLPSPDSLDLPSLCFKKSHGLLSRVAESNESEKLIFESTRLFGSREGEKVEECSCSVKNVDSMTVSEELVMNVDRFVKVMDEVSDGGFLRGEESELGSDWVELNWLKAKGYYSMEAFAANRLEVGLRLAWLNCNNGKKRGVKLKEKATMAGMAANAFWRKKGCIDWWDKLDDCVRKKIFTAVLGKSAKSLTHEILNWANSASEDEICLSNIGVVQPSMHNCTVSSQSINPTFLPDSEIGLNIVSESRSGESTSSTNAFKSLFVLQDIIMLVLSCIQNGHDKGSLFFSRFGSIFTVSDCVLRKLREFLMVISLEFMKLELLGEENNKVLPSKSKDKPVTSSRKKKGRSRTAKRQNSVPTSCVDDLSCEKSIKGLCRFAPKGKEDLMELSKMSNIPRRNQKYGEMSSSEHDRGIGVEKVQAATKKNRKEKRKNKKSGCGSNSKNLPMDSSSNCQDQAANSEQAFDKLSISCSTSDDLTDSGSLILNSSPSILANGSTKVKNAAQKIGQSITESSNGYSQFSSAVIKDQSPPSGIESINGLVHSKATSPPVSTSELNKVVRNKDVNINGYLSANEFGSKLASLDRFPQDFDVKEDSLVTPAQYSGETCEIGTTSSLKCSPYEWPSLAPLYFPSVNPHLPPATDRLHLDVGYNWHNHFRHSFVPTIHPARSSPIEGRCNPILARSLPMSLDWPPMVRGACELASSLTCNYDSGFISRRQSNFHHGFTPQCVQLNSTLTDDEKYSGDLTDLHDLSNTQDLVDECDRQWISEEELEVHAVSGIDYNQYFGGGVMYWNPSEHHGTGFSRPPSLSSDDSSWAWREADMTRAVDDMVSFPSYGANGLTSPTAATFCSPFDSLGSGHQALGYVMPGNDVPNKLLHSSSTKTDTAAQEEASGSLAHLPGDIEGKTRESLPYPILRPIIIPNVSRERSREFKRSHDRKSPCVPPNRREQPRIKRPPSPVVLCVPRAPHPPSPSPVSDSRKHRGFPTVRSGSSSPRHWGMKGWYLDGTNSEESCLRMDGAEVVWPSWRKDDLSTRPLIQPLSATLLQDRLIATSQIARDQEHPDVAVPLQPPESQSCPTRRESLHMLHSLLHDEIDTFCKHVTMENMAKKPYVTWAVKRVTRSLQVLWPRSRTNIFGSNASGLSLPTSDVDLVVCLPPVRNLEPIKEAGILEGRNGIKETCLQHAARYLANQEWVKNDSLKTVENTAIPIIMLVVEVPHDIIISSASNVQSPKDDPSSVTEEQVAIHSELIGLEDSALPKCTQINYDATKDSKSIRIDISFKTPSHTGLQTTELVKELTQQFPAVTPLALVLKQFLADRSLDQSYSGGLSSYCLVLLITRFLQHEHHLGRPINQNFGSLLMDFLYFFGNVFDPRQMRISVQGSGIYIKRERGYSIDPIHIDDPLFLTNNVGRNCFRIHQCIKAFSDAYSVLENEFACLPDDVVETSSKPPYRLLQKIIPSIDQL